MRGVAFVFGSHCDLLEAEHSEGSVGGRASSAQVARAAAHAIQDSRVIERLESILRDSGASGVESEPS